MLRAPAVAVFATLLTAALASCSSGGEGYEVHARFARAVALYDDSEVLVMGIPVGHVTDVSIDGQEIAVSMSIDEGVPLPADVSAAIVASSLIGERNVVLGPAWTPGDERLEAGTTIPVERTSVPVEPDEALESVTQLLGSLDPESVALLLEEGSGALDGNGSAISSTLVELSRLLPYLAEQDDELLALAGDVAALADVVRARDDQIGQLLEDFATVADVVAQEREDVVAFIDAIASLSAQGRALLTSYEVTLPEDLETLATVALTVQVNADAVSQALQAIEGFQEGVFAAYDPETSTVRARVNASESGLDPLLAALDLISGGLPCLPVLETGCQR